MSRPTAVTLGIAGYEIEDQERDLIQQIQPFGFILFKRNCKQPKQVRALVADLKSCVEHDPPIMIDQEGGRVSRLQSPPWPPFPAPGTLPLDQAAGIGSLDDAIYWHARLTGEVLRNLDVTVNCAPMLDIPVAGSDAGVLGDRTISDDPEVVESAGLHFIRGLREAGIVPVIKHLPGHGRATVDSHAALPVINSDLDTLDASDFRPFAAASLFYGSRVMGMTGHLLLPAVDDKPITLSSKIIQQVIRDKIGFSGHLMADDIEMGALSGGDSNSLGGRASAAIAAGCDSVLFCAPKTNLWLEVADAVGEISESGWSSWQSASAAGGAAATPMDHETFISHHRRWLTPALIAMSNRHNQHDPTAG